MKNILLLFGIALMIIAATLSAAHSPIYWGYFTVSTLLLAVFILLQKQEQKKSLVEKRNNEYSLLHFENYLKELLKGINELSKNKTNKNYINKLNDTIDNLLPNIDDYRIQMINQLGIANYTKLSIPFAKAERLINRGVSAAVDGYLEESQKNILDSINFIEFTIREIEQIKDEQNG